MSCNTFSGGGSFLSVIGYWLIRVVVATSWCACGNIFKMSFATLLTLPFMKDFSITCNAVMEHFTHRTSLKIGVIFSNPATALSTKFQQYSKSFVVISTLFITTSSGVDSISRNHSLCSATRSSSSVKVLNHEIATVQSHLQAPFLIPVLRRFPLHLQLLFPLKS